MSKDDSCEDGEDAGSNNDGDSTADGGGSEAIRIPSESPSKSWWNMIAVTRDTT